LELIRFENNVETLFGPFTQEALIFLYNIYNIEFIQMSDIKVVISYNLFAVFCM